MMTATVPSRKDVAEFFRLGLLAGTCKVCAIQSWAEQIVVADSKPHIAFVELCICGTQPESIVQRLLSDVPGLVTPDLPVRMLLGHASHLLTAGSLEFEELLPRLYCIAGLENFPGRIHSELVCMEDGLALARDGAYGTVPEISRGFALFLDGFAPYAPHVP